MTLIAFIRDIKSSAGVFFSPEEIVNSNHLTSVTHSPPSAKVKESIQTAKTSQIVSLRQSYQSPPWGVNIPPYRQLAIESCSPSSSSSSPESSVSSAFHARRSQRPLLKSGFGIESTTNVDNPSNLPQLDNIPQYGNDLHANNSDGKDIQHENSDTINNLRSSDDATTSRSQPIDFISKYSNPLTRAKFTSTESAVTVFSLGTTTTSSSFCSLNPVNSPKPHRHQSISADTGQELNLFPVNQSPTPSPPAASSPATCHTCRFPLQRTSSETSFLLNLSHRSPLFDDLDEDSAAHFSDPSHVDTHSIEDRRHSTSPSSFSSSSPEAFHSLSSWWSDIPPHRRAHIIEAESWPIFTPSAPLPINDSSVGEQCACPGPPTHPFSSESSEAACTDQNHHSKEPSHASSPPSPGNLQSRLSFSKNLNLLVPIPLDHNETDPLLSTSPSNSNIIPLPPMATENFDSHEFDTTFQPIKRKKRKEESLSNSSESLLTKSLRRLSRKLPNIQWGNLSVRMQSNTIDGKIATPGEEEQEEESVLPSGVVDEESSVGLAYEDEKAQISRLVKSWTSDNIQPQNSLNGSFINDPEMEWSSMVVQLETFSPSSSRKLRLNLQDQVEKKIPRSSRAQQYSRKCNSSDMDSTTSKTNERRRSFGESNEATPHQKENQVKKSQTRRNNRATRNQPQQLNNENKKNLVKITKRVVSNPLHLLQLTLELEMMRKMKINSPLKQRSMKLILVKRSPSSQSINNSNSEFDYVGSPLRFEI